MKKFFTLFLSLAVVMEISAQPMVSILSDAQDDPAKFGLQKIVSALNDKKISSEQIHSLDAMKGNYLIVAGLATNEIFFGEVFKSFRESIPTNSESLAIQKITAN